MLKIAFWGTPTLTTHYLDALHNAGMTPVVIITNPDRPKGRGHELAPTPAKEWGLSHGIPVLQPTKLEETFSAQLEAFSLDISIVVAYGSIIPEKLINLPKHKTLNVHYSLLPRYRGAAPTEAAILSGDTETGCAIQVMARALDSGPIIATQKIAIEEDETTTELRARLTALGATLLVETIPAYCAGSLTETVQNESLATHCGKIKKEDGLIELSNTALENYRKYRAYVEWPRTYFFTEQNGKNVRLIITKAHYEHNTFVIDRVLPEGKKEIAYGVFLKSH